MVAMFLFVIKYICITIIIIIGIEHHLKLRCCKCEPIAMTMVRARLWPGSPTNPRLSFTFELLDWAEALLLECQVAVKDLCAALAYKCPHLQVKVQYAT